MTEHSDSLGTWDYCFPSAMTEPRGLVVPNKLCHFNNFLKLFVVDLEMLTRVPDDIICTKHLMNVQISVRPIYLWLSG